MKLAAKIFLILTLVCAVLVSAVYGTIYAALTVPGMEEIGGVQLKQIVEDTVEKELDSDAISEEMKNDIRNNIDTYFLVFFAYGVYCLLLCILGLCAVGSQSKIFVTVIGVFMIPVNLIPAILMFCIPGRRLRLC